MERLTRQQRQQVTRDRLIEAAAQLFAERGLTASLDDVATAAGLTKGAVYSNFANKEALILALIERRMAQHPETNACQLIADPSVPLNQRMAALAELYHTSIETPASRDFVLLMTEFWAAALRNPRMHEAFIQELRRVRAGIEEQLRGCFPEASLPMPTADLAALFLAVDFGLGIQHIVDPNESTGRRYAGAFELLLGRALTSETLTPDEGVSDPQ